jgi:hypothetical protein
MDRVDDPAQLHWEVQRKKNSKAIRCHIPCHVRVNLDERMDIPLKFHENDEFIRYMGVNYHFRGDVNRASLSNLVPYYGEEEDRTKWSPKLMQMHLKSMKARREFQENTKLKLRVEELALQYMLDEVLARHEKKKSQAASTAVKRRNNPRIYSPAQWEESPTPRGSPTPTTSHQQLNIPNTQTLRAGDVISFYHEMNNRHETCTIVKVNATVDEYPLETDAGPFVNVMLKWDVAVRIYKEGSSSFEISSFNLDPSQNGKFRIVTNAGQMGQAYHKMQNDLKDCQDDFWGDSAKEKDATKNVKDDDTIRDHTGPNQVR